MVTIYKIVWLPHKKGHKMDEKKVKTILEKTKDIENILKNEVEIKEDISINEVEEKVISTTEKMKLKKRSYEKKFKRVGTKLNEKEMTKLEKRLEELNMNQSQYFKHLIAKDFEEKEENILKKVISFLKSFSNK